MKLWRSMLAMLFCSGLIIGLTACGDDDDEEEQGGGMTCGEAYDQVTSTECRTQAGLAVNPLKTCVEAAVAENDIEECLTIFEAVVPACLPGVDILFNNCGQCQEDCGIDFAGDDGVPGCLLDPQKTGTECLTDLFACVDAC